jgi:hypothetical protein
MSAVRVYGLTKAMRRSHEIKTGLPKAVDRSVSAMSRGAVGDLKATLLAAHVESYNGELYGDGIRANKQGRTTTIEVIEHGIMLDGMRPHIVRVDSSRPNLLRWAAQARRNDLRSMAASVSAGTRDSFKVLVTAHPFIQKGVNRSRGNNAALLRNQLRTLGIGAGE